MWGDTLHGVEEVSLNNQPDQKLRVCFLQVRNKGGIYIRIILNVVSNDLTCAFHMHP